jgi:ribosomal protein S18 acetylase RimI-like enzyme
MIQVLEHADSLEVGEIQILPAHQNRGLGSRLLEQVIEDSATQERDVILSVGLKNDGAFRLYRRLGFRESGRDETHIHMRQKSGVKL